MAQISVYPDAAGLADAAAEYIATLAAQSIAGRGRFTLALSGGGTPRPVYERLAAPALSARIDWTRTQLFFGDERCVPPEDPRSNYAMVKEALLERAPIPAANVHRVRGEDDPQRAARGYEALLERLFGRSADGSPAEGFDLVLLGMGDNGHTASLFPGSAVLGETRRWVAADDVEAVGMWRVTLTAPLINCARHVAFLVSGAGKAQMLARVLEGPRQPALLPAQIVQPARGELRWMLDASAAARLSRALVGRGGH
ncbi:MAG TPA: 6-phosphogluconolactonase [Burkholderiales bacterium]|nr:6-phosphogluconolactonase [Burkholderiales bacterium]